MARVDFILLHPPSACRFRDLLVFHCPISDVIPSSIFANYPIGFLTLLRSNRLLVDARPERWPRRPALCGGGLA